MQSINELREMLPEEAKDIKLNIQVVLDNSSLSKEQVWGVAIASAIASRNPRLRDATINDAREHVSDDALADAKAAASLMSMNNIYYRFRHMIEKEEYGKMSPKLRMNWLAKPASSKENLELFSLAVSAINGCGMCIGAHEEGLRKLGISTDQINDTIRIASVFHAAAVSLELGS